MKNPLALIAGRGERQKMSEFSGIEIVVRDRQKKQPIIGLLYILAYPEPDKNSDQ
jgi:hypothetical protein